MYYFHVLLLTTNYNIIIFHAAVSSKSGFGIFMERRF